MQKTGQKPMHSQDAQSTQYPTELDLFQLLLNYRHVNDLGYEYYSKVDALAKKLTEQGVGRQEILRKCDNYCLRLIDVSKKDKIIEMCKNHFPLSSEQNLASSHPF